MHPTDFFLNSVHAPAQCLQEVSFQCPTASFFSFPPVLAEVPAFHLGVITGRQMHSRGKTWGGARRSAVRQWSSGRKSAAFQAADWLSYWRLSWPPRQFQAGWRGIGKTVVPWRWCMETTANWRQAVREEPLIRAPDWECKGRSMIEGN